MIQMIHWFTKNHHYENPETMSMLDTFMVGDFSYERMTMLVFRME
jgi:hypothetical protein